jgi:hypothetical protein
MQVIRTVCLNGTTGRNAGRQVHANEDTRTCTHEHKYSSKYTESKTMQNKRQSNVVRLVLLVSTLLTAP